MKKIFIGTIVLATLVIYSLGVRHERPKVGSPVSLSTGSTTNTKTNSAVSTASGSSSTSGSGAATQSQAAAGAYKDGSYTGSTEDAFYGNVQVKVTVQNGKIAVVNFLQYPHTHDTSVFINQQAMPLLQQEAIKAQNAHVDVVSGATYTSQAFVQSLSNALSQAA